MTEEQIERTVEAKIDRLDKRFMRHTPRMTQAEYDAEMAEIRRWEETEMRFVEKPRE